MRIGHGFDVHCFGEGDYIVLGGVKIPHSYGLVAYSDGDVLLHAICDALLGAASLGDIGQHFSDDDERYAGIDSRKLLRHVIALLEEHGLTPVNMDSTIIAQSPQMAPHIDQMRQNISEDMCIAPSLLNVKATTTEKLGYIGRKEGIAVHAIVLLKNLNP